VTFLRFLEKRPLTVKFLKYCSESFYRDADRRVLYSRFVIFGGRDIGEIVRCLPDNKISPGSPAVAAARIAPTIR